LYYGEKDKVKPKKSFEKTPAMVFWKKT